MPLRAIITALSRVFTPAIHRYKEKSIMRTFKKKYETPTVNTVDFAKNNVITESIALPKDEWDSNNGEWS